ncbi:MAG: zinc ABC transporter substrate-binding protein [Oscillospiraceae bacterium]|nr:zinc ABC transporter substrate-binding protein [Oscillospiraceae bacterium]
MKKLLSIVLCLSVMLTASAGFVEAKASAAGGKLSIVTTIFPEYDWVMNILGDRAADADVSMLLDNGVDLHSYQPTVDDIVRISACDLFLYVGGESDKWVDDALKEAANKNMVVINLLDVLGEAVKEEELVEGMEEDEDEEDDGESPEFDEHVWLSLKNAQVLCRAIADALATLDPEHQGEYRSNADAYIGQLSALDDEYRAAVDQASLKTLLFGDRFPFRYLTDDYGLAYYAAFAGCSAETEASFDTIIFLASKVDELDLPAILQLESSDGSISRTVLRSTKGQDAEILTMDSMQSVTAKDVAAEASYLVIMEANLAVLKAALQR